MKSDEVDSFGWPLWFIIIRCCMQLQLYSMASNLELSTNKCLESSTNQILIAGNIYKHTSENASTPHYSRKINIARGSSIDVNHLSNYSKPVAFFLRLFLLFFVCCMDDFQITTASISTSYRKGRKIQLHNIVKWEYICIYQYVQYSTLQYSTGWWLKQYIYGVVQFRLSPCIIATILS